MKDQKLVENNRLVLQGFREAKRAIVQKSNPLLSLNRKDFSLAELKLLDIYLARINSHDPEHRTVRLKKREIENILGVDRIRREELEKRINKLFVPITLEMDVPEGYEEAFRKMVLFEVVDLYRRKDGYWEIELCCTEKAKTAIFNIENLGYFKYKLANVIKLKSRYSYSLYLFLEQSRKSEFALDFETVRDIVNCTSPFAYSEEQGYKQFNFKILKPAAQEINEKTTLEFHYETVKDVGNKRRGYIFYINKEKPERKKKIEKNNFTPSKYSEGQKEPKTK